MSDSSDLGGLSPTQNLRTSDIAQAVGVHPNTVRLYEEWGYLPSIPRNRAGYRQFAPNHLAQMKLARLAFADPFPGRHIRRSLAGLVRLAALGDLDGAMDAALEHSTLVARELAQTAAAATYLELWVTGDIETDEVSQPLLSGQTAELLQVSKDTLRHWERNGLIDPPRDSDNRYRLYGAQEIGRLRVLRILTRAGYSTMAVLRMVHHLDRGSQADLGDLLNSPSEDEDVLCAADRWLTTLSIHEERSLAIINHLDEMLATSGAQ